MNSQEVIIYVNGLQVQATVGQSLASVLRDLTDTRFAVHPVTSDLGQGFCGMGICFECEVLVDGVDDVRSCLVKVTNGMNVQIPDVAHLTKNEGDR